MTVDGPADPQGVSGDCGCPIGPAQERQPGRRALLHGSLAAGALAALGAVGLQLRRGDASVRYAFAAPRAGGEPRDVLVVLSLRGGFDGLNAVVPIGDPGYRDARPRIGIPERMLIPAGGVFGLHPALAPLKPWWDAGRFGAVHAVGQADPSRSHFRAMAELERAAPGSGLRTGWLDRTLSWTAPPADAEPAAAPGNGTGTPFRATGVGSMQLPAALAGPVPALSMTAVDQFDLYGGFDDAERARWAAALRALYAGAPAALAGSVDAALAAVGTSTRLAAAGYRPAGGASYPSGSLGDALRDVARLIKASVGLQVACVDDGDWDMHAGAGTVDDGWMTEHLGTLAAALAAFATDLGPLLDRVILVTLSEFGRRVAENGSGGSDHGHGNAVLLLGGGVVGGRVHGHWPGLAPEQLADGDLAGSTDYRLVLGEILQRRCGLGSVRQVFPGLTGSPLGVVRSAGR